MTKEKASVSNTDAFSFLFSKEKTCLIGGYDLFSVFPFDVPSA